MSMMSDHNARTLVNLKWCYNGLHLDKKVHTQKATVIHPVYCNKSDSGEDRIMKTIAISDTGEE